MMLSLANRLLVAIQTRNTHASLAAECKSFGLADPPSSDDTGSKAERIQRRLEQMSDRDIARAAERAGAYYKDYEIEESALQFLEADELPLTEITRRDIAACFDSSAFPLSGQLGIIDLVARIFPLDGMEFAAFGLGPNFG